MAFQNRGDSVSNGYQIPAMPRVPRSAKGKRSSRKKNEDNQMCAFDLLATLAGKLLAEKEELWVPWEKAEVARTLFSKKQKLEDNDNPYKGGIFDRGSCTENPNFQISHASKSIESRIESYAPPLVHCDRDDGENSSGCTHPRYVHNKSFKIHCAEEDQRRRKMKLNHGNDGELFNDDLEIKPVFRGRRQRSSFKKRKLSDGRAFSPSSTSSPDETVLDSPLKIDASLEVASDLISGLNDSNNISCDTKDQNSFYDSEDHRVKLSIKSFRVPELFIEMPANATVGSLKRTVMEAVNSILGDGLRVGILLQGKKVRDDNKTLRQAGISYEDNMNSLGFTLEPNPRKSPPANPNPLNKPQVDAANASIPMPICHESDYENSVHSSIDRSSFEDRTASDSKAIIPVLDGNPEALSIVPIRKLKRSDVSAQRRIRRPFSVPEVEALVQAVEKLGTGRWRDVKIRAFDNAKHRTYVDLKDKWKTLVHTARISPQQRRGEPVPQELLDRVLSAHAYWSLQQAKLPSPANSLLVI